MTTRARQLVLLLLSAACACSEQGPERPEHGRLAPGVVARVGETDVFADSVRRIAAAQRVSVEQACERAASDALFALALRSDPASADIVRVTERAAHARALVETFEERARRAGPPSDHELELMIKDRWRELDRPPVVRTTHVVAMVKKPEDDAAARQVAEQLASAIAGIHEPEAFMKRAREVASNGIEVRAERLPPVTPDGRTFDADARPGAPDQRFDEEFSRAAAALASPGDQSPIVKTPFGYHVILLEERLPEQRVPLEESRELLEHDVYAARARAELKKLIAEQRQQSVPDVSRAAEELTAKVVLAP